MVGAAPRAGAGTPDRRPRSIPAAPKASQPVTGRQPRSRLGQGAPSPTRGIRRAYSSYSGTVGGDIRGTATRRAVSTNGRNSFSTGTGSAEQLHRQDSRFRLTDFEEFSPRLTSLETSSTEPLGAPLLPPPQAPNAEPDERFCTGGPNIDGPGAGSRKFSKTSAVELSFQEMVARLEAALSQASMLLNDRLRALKSKCHLARLSDEQEAELCEIADGVAAAAYHAQKWAFLLQKPEKARQPAKPPRCESAEEAFAAMHFTMPKLMVNATEAQKELANVVKKHGNKAQEHVIGLGVCMDDVRAIEPHLEHLLLRLGRLAHSIRVIRQESLREFVPIYFARAIGLKPARRLLVCLFP
mmetsp:Transcript_102058/g.288800  ORF Transcript_102058/g.288800 Transcript_102058/m.288800 type:complete len:355 (-) Transcript_102058:111-1175(-)